MNFYHDVIECLLDYFQKHLRNRHFRRLQERLQAKKTYHMDGIEKDKYQCSELMRIFLSYDNRLIKPIRHQVFFSKELKNQLNGEFHRFQSVVANITECLRTGQDVYCRLNTEMEDVLYEDLLLNDWRMYHFHLGERGQGKFCQRSGSLLIAFIPLNHQEVYLLQIVSNHDNNTVFADKDFLRIVKNNWPEAIAYCRMPEVVSTMELTIEQRLALRENGVCTVDMIDGDAYIGPGMGVTSAGTSVYIQIQTDNIYNWIGINILRCQERMRNFIPQQIPEYLTFIMSINFKRRRFEIYSNRNELIAYHKY